MLEHPLVKAAVITIFCGAVAFAATWVRQRQIPAADRTTRPTGLSPLGAGLTAMIGALLGITLFRGWPP